nr:unnamed protein product [Digitaria exilis]
MDQSAGGTPGKGRLHSYHTTPQSFPTQSLPSRAKYQEEEDEVQTLKKQAGPKNTGRGCNSGAARRPRALQYDWTEEQDMALRKAYFNAQPSPHFWKRVSKLVPGRSAEDCFNRIHADLSTPTPVAPHLLEVTAGRQRTAKQKSLAAQRTVRHLLQKHCLIDQAQEADHFSLFETSPSALQLNISFEDSPGTPESYLNSGSLGKSGSLSARKKQFSKLRAERAEPSPAVLEPIKNVILHEKYVDQLSRWEVTKKPRKRTPGSKAVDSGKTLSRQQAGGLKAAKTALISEATDFINLFKKLQANSLALIVENNEDDDIDGI